MRFSLIDRITAMTPRKSITAVKTVALAEEYLADHFPGFPVLPGVLMVEALVQAGAWLMRVSEEFRFSTILLRQAKAVRFNQFVLPGQTLTVHAKVVKAEDSQWVFQANGEVEGERAVSARVILGQFNLADQVGDQTMHAVNSRYSSAQAKAADDRLRYQMKEMFTQLWKG